MLSPEDKARAMRADLGMLRMETTVPLPHGAVRTAWYDHAIDWTDDALVSFAYDLTDAVHYLEYYHGLGDVPYDPDDDDRPDFQNDFDVDPDAPRIYFAWGPRVFWLTWDDAERLGYSLIEAVDVWPYEHVSNRGTTAYWLSMSGGFIVRDADGVDVLTVDRWGSRALGVPMGLRLKVDYRGLKAEAHGGMPDAGVCAHDDSWGTVDGMSVDFMPGWTVEPMGVRK